MCCILHRCVTQCTILAVGLDSKVLCLVLGGTASNTASIRNNNLANRSFQSVVPLGIAGLAKVAITKVASNKVTELRWQLLLRRPVRLRRDDD